MEKKGKGLIRRIRSGIVFVLLFALLAELAPAPVSAAKDEATMTLAEVTELELAYSAMTYTYKNEAWKSRTDFDLPGGTKGSAIVDGDTAATISRIKYILARNLLDEILVMLNIVITETRFQNQYLRVRDLISTYNGYYSALGIYAKAKEYAESTESEEKYKSQQLLSRVKNLDSLYETAKLALRKIYHYIGYSLSAANVQSYINEVIGKVDNSSNLVPSEDSVKKAVDKYYDTFDKMAVNGQLWNVLVGANVSDKDKNRDFLLDGFATKTDTTNFLQDFNFTVSDTDATILPARSMAKTYLACYKDMLITCDLEYAYVVRLREYISDTSLPQTDIIERSFEEVETGTGTPLGLYAIYKKLCGSTASGGLGSQVEADTFIRSLFNGSDGILPLIRQYENVKAFRSALGSLPANPSTPEEVTRAIDVYNKYATLTDAEKKRIPADDLEKLNNSMPVSTTVSQVKALIDAITYPKNETEYKNTFLPKLQAAETAYNALLKLYPNTGIESFIDNRTKLTDIYMVYRTYQDRVFEALAIENESVCNKLSTVIEPLRNELVKLNQTKTDVYNHLIGNTTLEERYKDATTAKKLRQRVDALMMSPTSEDKTELNSIKTAVAGLNKQAKAYFGSLYEQYIQALEYGTYTDDLNKANRVDTLISRIGTVTSTSGDKIKAAQTEYEALTAVQKSLVKNYPVLVAAIKTYGELSKDIGFAFVSNIKKGYVYTHSAIEPVPVVKVGETTLTKDVHYRVNYANNLNVGTGTVTITSVEGAGYVGSYQKTFIIVRDSVENCGVSGLKAKYKWTGKSIKPKFTVTVNGFDIKKDSDYNVTYSKNIKPGTAKITIKGIGNYKGSVTRTFKIYKKKKKK
ncbi:MAG: hypothetical protein IKQ97_09785, partial [Eubacterium sp.]|nr:hypothetical protein [Eubacterium sp.]